MDSEQRGSEKLWGRLFESEVPKGADLAKALSLAADDYTVKRWWKYGQPAIDSIRGVLDVPSDRVSGVLGSLVKMHGGEIQVSFDVFPYGIVAPDGVHINILLERNVGGG